MSISIFEADLLAIVFENFLYFKKNNYNKNKKIKNELYCKNCASSFISIIEVKYKVWNI